MLPAVRWFVSLSVLSAFELVLSQDFIGCGGFIRSDVEIDFTLIRVRLYTKQGNIKDEAECAPNNGYYMIPVYEKGEYVLQVEPPSGWGLTPDRVTLKVDGSSDPCSKGEDINFQFTGFGLIGKVVSSLSETGPAGVRVNLKSAAGEVQQSTITSDGGRYIFANVLPGQYIVEASHPVWQFEKASALVEVSKVTGDAGSSLVVHGYDVTGSIESEGESVRGVSFLLFSDTEASPEVYGCNEAPNAEYSADKRVLCQVTSDEQGTFTFRSVPVGRYYMVPVYKGQLTSFEVRPSKETFAVDHDSFRFPQPFLVTGFAVSGTVRSSAKGAAVAGAKVSLDGKYVATTDASGSFQLAGVKSGVYSIGVTAEHMHFSPSKHKVTPTTPTFPDVLPDRFDICGQIVITDTAAGASARSLRSYPEGDPSKVTIATTNRDGTFCISAPVGVRLVIEPTVSEAEKRAGLRLAPERRLESAIDRPVTGVVFSQFLATVRGSVTCLETCGPSTVTLRSLDKTDALRSTELSVDGDNGASFAFDNVTPGRYKASILLDGWCWEPAQADVDVEKKVETVAFVHTGYKLSVNTSHDVTVNFAGEASLTNVTGVLNLHRGINHVCLPAKGAYSITPPDAFCHKFEQDQYSCNTKDAPNFINMKAVLHRMEGEVTLDAPATDVMVTVEGAGAQQSVLGPLQVNKKGDVFVGHFDFFASDEKGVRVGVASAEMLFNPSSVEVAIVAESCPAASVKLSGLKGIFFRGRVMPAVSGVAVRVTATDGTVAAMVLTDADGTYSIGPLSKSTGYGVQAEKAGYVLSPAPSVDISADHDFVAHKLAEVAVEVVDSADLPLGGVLLSLTGGSAYKSNNLTYETGRFSFVGLAPGRYFIRPLLKEYQFQPSSQFVDVKEGELIPVRLIGTRVAFSCFGKMTSVHGEPEHLATIEAVGLDECSKYVEEARTENDGTFRIRGLKPSCRYKLILKSNSSSPDRRIDRIVPDGQVIEVKDADINTGLVLAIRPLTYTDVCVFTRAKEEHVSSIKLKLYRAESKDETLLQVVTLGQSSVSFFNPVLKNGQRHIVRLESTLPPAMYDYVTPEAVFISDSASKHLSLEFSPKLRPSQQDVGSGGSFVALALTLASFVLFFNYRQVVELVRRLLESAMDRRRPQPPQQRSAAGGQPKAVRQAAPAAAPAAASGPPQAVLAAASDSSTDLAGDLDWLSGRKDKKTKPRRA